MKILDKIESPEDVKQLNIKDCYLSSLARHIYLCYYLLKDYICLRCT